MKGQRGTEQSNGAYPMVHVREHTFLMLQYLISSCPVLSCLGVSACLLGSWRGQNSGVREIILSSSLKQSSHFMVLI